jgi:hypothetical protein
MIKIHIPFDTIVQYRNLDFMKLYHASNHGIELAEWCKDQGLIMNLHFEWAVSNDEKRLTFTFLDKGEKYSSMFALKFGSGDRGY